MAATSLKFTKRNDRVSREGVRTGFNDADVTYLNRWTDTPKTQIFSSEEIIEDPAKETFFCAMCKGVLDYDKHLDAYSCKSCVQYYEITNLQDTPLKDIKDFQLAPYNQLQHYPVYDENDPNTPFIEGIHLDELEEGLENREYEDQRVHFDINITVPYQTMDAY